MSSFLTCRRLFYSDFCRLTKLSPIRLCASYYYAASEQRFDSKRDLFRRRIVPPTKNYIIALYFQHPCSRAYFGDGFSDTFVVRGSFNAILPHRDCELARFVAKRSACSRCFTYNVKRRLCKLCSRQYFKDVLWIFNQKECICFVHNGSRNLIYRSFEFITCTHIIINVC